MGLLDSAIDQAAGMLGGDSGGGSAPKPDTVSPLKWQPGDDITPPPDKPPISAAPNAGDSKHTGVNTPAPIEFPHYGYVHNEMSNFFSHPAFDNEPGKKPAGRAILFRDAVEREALLLYSFIAGAKAAHEDYKKSFGAMGALSGMINKLAGTTGAPDPDPASLIYLLDDIATNTKPINASAIKYVPVHLTGINLHQTRSDYQKYCTDKLEKAFLKKKDDSPADAVSKLVDLSFLGDGANFIFGLLSKATNIYFGVYLMLRSKYEPDVEKVCHDTSIDVIRKYQVNTFSWWYKPPKAPDNGNNASNDGGALGDAEKAVGDASKSVDKAKKDVLDVAGAPDEPGSGEPAIDQLFQAFGSAPEEKDPENMLFDASLNTSTPASDDTPKPKPKELKPDEVCSAYVKQGFSAVIFGDPKDKTIDTAIAGAIGKYVETASWVSVEFLKEIYKKLCRGTGAIDDKWVLDTAHDVIFDKIFDKLEHLSDVITKAKKTTVGVQGQKVGTEKLVDKGEDAIKQLLGPKLDVIIQQIACDMSDRLEKLRVYAYDAATWTVDSDRSKWGKSPSKSLTLEVYLGQLPFFLALLVRNTTFPVWKMFVTQLTGGNSALEAALKPITNFLADAGDIADRVKKANDLFNQQGANVGTDPAANAAQYAAIATAAKKKTDSSGKKPKTDGYPGAARITKSDKIDDIVQDDIDKAKKDRKATWTKNVPD